MVVYGDDWGGGDRFGKFLGQKDRLHAENGGFQNGTQQELNKMVDMVQFGGQKDRSDAKNGGQNSDAYLLTFKEGVSPRPLGVLGRSGGKSNSFNHCCRLMSHGFVGLCNHVFKPLLQPILTN